MSKSTHRYALRLIAAGAVMIFAMACGNTTCSCVEPLDEPMADSEKVYDGIQARLTPVAFDFIENNLPEIISTFMQGGLSFDVPYTDASQSFGWCPLCITINIRICENGCTLTADIVDASLSRLSPDTLAMDALVNLSGTITLNGTFDCDIPIDIQNKPVGANIRLLIDPDDHLMSFELRDLTVTLEDSDYSITCDWGFLSDIGLGGVIDSVINWIAGLLTPLLNGVLESQVDGFLGGALDAVTCLACDFYGNGCPAGSTCNGDGFCESGGGECLTNPLGLVGAVDMGAMLESFAPGLDARLDVFAVTGQWLDATVDPLVVNDGVEMRIIGGADADRHMCVPVPDPAEVPDHAPPPRLPFTDIIPGTTDPYMAGIGVSDAFLDWFLYKAHLSGLFCLALDSASTGGMLTSGTLSMLLGSLNSLTGGQNTSVKLKLVPSHVPYLEIGAGTFTTDPDGNRIMDEPLLNVYVPGIGIDFYAMLDGRWTRLVTLTQDLTLYVGLDFRPDNTVMPLFDENSIQLDNVVATNYELLAEDPTVLADLVPTLIGLVMPLLTDQMGFIEVPPIEGFVLNMNAVQGDLPRPNTNFFEYLGIYANLALEGARVPPPRETSASLSAVRVPVRSLMDIYAPGGPSYPEVIVDVAADQGSEAEFSWRLDGGPWSVFQSGPQLTVHDPRLALGGEHRLEIQSRSTNDYRTLDPEPVQLTVAIEPREDGQTFVPPPTKAALDRFSWLSSQPRAQLNTPAEEEERQRVGCSTSGSGLGLFGLLGLVGLALRRRRCR